MKYKLICTHNPQDFYNGNEPYELAKVYVTEALEKDVKNELYHGYKVIVTEAVQDGGD